jgi:hypothetical protein
MHCKISGAGRLRIRTSHWTVPAVAMWIAALCILISPLAARAQKEEPQRTITVKGKLDRVMAIGGESTGWSIHLSEEITIDGKQFTSIEIDFSNAKKLEKLEKREVKATGTVIYRHGVETGERPILKVSAIKGIAAI